MRNGLVARQIPSSEGHITAACGGQCRVDSVILPGLSYRSRKRCDNQRG